MGGGGGQEGLRLRSVTWQGLGEQLAKFFLDLVMVARVLNLDYVTKACICFMRFPVSVLFYNKNTLNNRNS